MKLKGQVDEFYNSYKVLHMELAGLSSTVALIESSRKAIGMRIVVLYLPSFNLINIYCRLKSLSTKYLQI